MRPFHAFLTAALAVVCVSTEIVVTAAEYNGPTDYVDLPGFRPDEVKTTVVLAKGVVTPSAAAPKLTLMNPDAESKSAVVSYELVGEGSSASWRIEALTKLKQRKPIAKVFVQGSDLAFQWADGVLKGDGAQLRNCVLGIAGVTEQAIALRVPLKQTSLLLDMSKEFNRLPLFDDLPDDGLLLSVNKIEGATVSNEQSADTAGLKMPLFVGLKGAESTVPGARLRVIIWKTSLKPEVIVRPELVPSDPTAASSTTTSPTAPAPNGFGVGVPRPAVPKPTVASNVNDGSDPTKPNAVNLPYTIKALTAAKTVVTRDLTTVNTQINLKRSTAAAKQRELIALSGDFVGTQDEIDALIQRRNRLMRDINQLLNEADQMQQKMVPKLEAQLAAFPPLETLGNSLHQKAFVGLRVYYTVAGKPVDVLVASGPPPALKK